MTNGSAVVTSTASRTIWTASRVRPPWQRYGLAVAVVVMAIVLRLVLLPFLGTKYPFVTLFPVVVVSALWAGFGPGMLAAALSFGLAFYLGFSSGVPFNFGTPTDRTAMIINLVGATFVCFVAASMRRAKRALRLQQEHLQELVAQRTAELENSNALLRKEVDKRAEAETRLRAALVAKDDFIAALSHELRTPLNPVLLIASEAAANPSLPTGVRQDFDLIAKNVRLEARLIDDLLDITRINHGKMALDVQSVRIDEVLAEALANVRDELQQKNIRLHLQVEAAGCTVRGDAARLQQVLWNVLKNAAKFTPQDGNVWVSSAVAGPQLFITVRDDGIGMTSEELTRVFTPFEQGDHAADGAGQFSGLGLGLSIASMLMERHSGTIDASSPGRGLGSTFVVKLPLTENNVLADTAVSPAAPAVTLDSNGVVRSRILLVEDDPSSRIALARLLTRRNYEVISTSSVTEALAAAAAQRFEFVLSDIGLPDQDGNVLMKEMRRLYGLRGIAISGFGTKEDIAASEAAGFFAHLTKPVSIVALEGVIADLRAKTGTTPTARAPGA